jgi:C1A family cysteine protease
MMQTGTEFSL